MKNYLCSFETCMEIEAENEEMAKSKFSDWLYQTDLIDGIEVEEIKEEE